MAKKRKKTTNELIGELAILSSQMTVKMDTKEKFISFFKTLSAKRQKDSIEKKTIIYVLLMTWEAIYGMSLEKDFDADQFRQSASLLPVNALICMVLAKKGLMTFSATIGDDVLSKLNLDEAIKDDYFSALFDMNKEQLIEEYLILKVS